MQTISCFDAVISHRLHANIISYSLLIPSIALVCDSKVKAFADLTERSSFCVSEEMQQAKYVFDIGQSAMLEDIDLSTYAKLKSICSNEIEELMRVLN